MKKRAKTTDVVGDVAHGMGPELQNRNRCISGVGLDLQNRTYTRNRKYKTRITTMDILIRQICYASSTASVSVRVCVRVCSCVCIVCVLSLTKRSW